MDASSSLVADVKIGDDIFDFLNVAKLIRINRSAVLRLNPVEQLVGAVNQIEERVEEYGFPIAPNSPLIHFAIVGDHCLKQTSGYAFFYPFYSTWRGKGLFLQDIFVYELSRNRGLGRQLLAQAAKHALETGCNQMRFAFFKHDKVAAEFLGHIGFENHTKEDGFQLGRFSGASLKTLAALNILHETNVSNGKYLIRKGLKEDCAKICELIFELATYQGFPAGPEMTRERLEKDGFASNEPFYQSAVLEDTKTQEIVGYAIFFPCFNSEVGKSMYLEDIYVQPAHRQKGNGRGLMSFVAQHAVETECECLNLAVLKDNAVARTFYSKYGFVNCTENDGLELCRFDLRTLQQLSRL